MPCFRVFLRKHACEDMLLQWRRSMAPDLFNVRFREIGSRHFFPNLQDFRVTLSG